MHLTTKNVLESSYPRDCEDKVYLICEVMENPQGWDVHLFSQDPVVWLNAQYKENFGNHSDYLVSELSKGDSKNKTLLSGGALVFYENRLVLLERDQKAPFYAGYVNEACGRCAEFPQTTIFKELAEELGVRISGHLAHFDSPQDVNQVSRRCVSPEAKLSPVRITLNNNKLQISPNKVSIYLDFELVQSIEGVSYFDRKNNVLEVRQIFEIDPGQECSFYDNEPYGRQIKILTPQEARLQKCVPYLEYILK